MTKPRRRPRPDDPAIAAARARFGRARDDRQSEIAEDYVELIDDLIRAHGEARATDIARSLGVSHVTVIRTVARLVRDGLAATEPYAAITLTEAGRALAERMRQRHAVVEAFLRAIGVDETTARQDAEGIEHHVSEATLAAMKNFLEKSQK